jgi:hypothetical protein
MKYKVGDLVLAKVGGKRQENIYSLGYIEALNVDFYNACLYDIYWFDDGTIHRNVYEHQANAYRKLFKDNYD